MWIWRPKWNPLHLKSIKARPQLRAMMIPWNTWYWALKSKIRASITLQTLISCNLITTGYFKLTRMWLEEIMTTLTYRLHPTAPSFSMMQSCKNGRPKTSASSPMISDCWHPFLILKTSDGNGSEGMTIQIHTYMCMCVFVRESKWWINNNNKTLLSNVKQMWLSGSLQNMFIGSNCMENDWSNVNINRTEKKKITVGLNPSS